MANDLHKAALFVEGDVVIPTTVRKTSHKNKPANHVSATYQAPTYPIARRKQMSFNAFRPGDTCMAACRTTGFNRYCTILDVVFEDFNGTPTKSYVVKAEIDGKVWSTRHVQKSNY